MTQPIYKLWQARFTEPWHQLPDEEQQRLMGQVGQTLGAVGAKQLVVCAAAWSSEQWPFFGLQQFPDMDALQRHAELQSDLHWYRYIESRTTLGTELVLP